MATATDKPRFTVRQLATKALREAGVTVNRIERVCPPFDTGGEIEIWFYGRVKGEKVPRWRTAYLSDCEGAELVLAEERDLGGGAHGLVYSTAALSCSA